MTENDYRQKILERLLERNSRESGFHEIIINNHRILERNLELKSENLALTVENEKLRNGLGVGDSAAQARIQVLEKKLLDKQEELTDMHKRKGDNQQMIIDLNVKVTELQKQLELKNNSLIEQSRLIQSLKAEVQMLTTKVGKLEELNSTLKDEHTALHLLHCSLEEKLRKTQTENSHMVERLMKFKAKDAEKMNEENETFLRKKNDAMKRELAEAARDSSVSSPLPINEDLFSGAYGNASNVYFGDEIPNRVHLQFDAHDGEVNAVKWSPLERIVATGGADRKVKLWDVGKGNTFELRANLIGSNQAVNSLDFDSTGTLILGTSNDFASRVWGIADHRLRHTLTGHSGKVMAAKFVGESQKIVTGSHDRTLKIWDLRSKACVETKFAGSSCNDLVTTDSSTIVSGHFDKKIRFWDTRSSDSSTNDIQLQGKVTSLDLSKDCHYLAACVRDDTIKIIDLRNNHILASLSHDSFKVGCDFARIAFNPDCSHIAAGSADGSLYIWNVNGKLVSILKDHT
ncbi:hypothetical protein ACKWTF_011613 [Chironomus riparius]